MNKTTVQIAGMHCRSCELLLEGEFKKIKGVKKVEASFKRKEVVVYSKFDLSDKKIENVAAKAGYAVGIEKPKSWVTSDPQTYKDLFTALLIFMAIYILARRLGIFNLSFGSKNNPSSLLVVLMVGLTAGFSTCMALVGGLILGISSRHAEMHPEATPMQKFRPHLYFNLGRIASYFVLGGLIGLIGKAFQLSGSVLGILTIIIGLVMLVVGFQLTELFPRLSNISLTLPTGLTRVLGIKKHHEKEYSHLNSALVGALTFFMPCGFTQAMQLYAMSTGNFLSGALIMGAFALGTAPGLLGIGGLTSAIKGAFARRFFKFAGIVVVSLAVFNISNELNLTGLTAKFSSSSAKSGSKASPTSDPNVVEANGKQIVRMTQNSNGYSPNSFTIKKGMPTKWIVNSTDPNSCAASLYSSQLNVRSYLKYGENIFEFTPTEVGRINFSCSMGMYRGYFEIVSNK
ncbi:sulfite exporter TauE/SafE family protein [Patescibacteria group bacterium]|nr:sulfite exporter TauE/SafE family protein [Patescibacteria group bacterium]